MRVIATRRERRAVIAEVKYRFGIGKSVDIKTVCIQICRQIIGREEKQRGRVPGFGTNFQQALDDFQRSKASYRVSVRCHNL